MTLIKTFQARKLSLQEIRQIFNSPGGQKDTSAVEVMERVALDLERLQKLIQETRSSASPADQPAVRIVATEALQKATGLCSLLVTLLQDIPLI